MSTENQGGFNNPDLVARMARNEATSGGARYGKDTTKRTDGGEDRTTNPRCNSCGSFVTRDFARVFGNNLNDVFGCLECMTATEVKKGGARAEDIDTTNLIGGPQL